MVSWKKQTSIIVLTILCSGIIPAAAVVTDDAKAVDISGGEDHTLLLTANKWPWASGDNAYSQLGLGWTNNALDQRTLVRVHGYNDVGNLQDISDLDAGWTHSLALDVNGLVWSWGGNVFGQLGNGTNEDRDTPVRVRSGEQDPNSQTSLLMYIERISGGRSGRHSLAVDANGYAYAWGYNKYGQCGNAVSGPGERELTPVYVRRGEQPQDANNPDAYLKHIIAVSGAQTHSMALEAMAANDANYEGKVYTFGSNSWPTDYGNYAGGSGKLGIGDSAEDSNTPVCVLRGEQDYNDPNQIYLRHIVGISAGWDHSMALEKDDPYDLNLNGRVYTWGNNGQGWAMGAEKLDLKGFLLSS